MDNQTLINFGLSIAMACAGWFARELWTAIGILRSEIRSIEVDLPNNYVKKMDIESRFDKIDLALVRIYDLLEKKQDKK